MNLWRRLMASTAAPIEAKTPAVNLDQITTYDLATSLGGAAPRINLDQLVGSKGLHIYSQMANDEQVKAVMNFKRDAITARGWTLQMSEDSSLSETERAARICVMNECVKRMKGSFSDTLNMVMTGRAYGFSITEKVYSQIQIEDKTWTGIGQLLGRDPKTFYFYTDDYGTLDRIEQRVSGKPAIDVDPSKVIHYVHSPEWDHVFGRSDLREAYNPWYAKTQVRNLWLLYLEKFAGGVIVAKRIDDSAPSFGTREYQSLQDALKNWKSLGSVILPQGIDAQVSMPTSTDAYEKAVTFHDLAIAKALLIPNLLGVSHTGQTGSFAQANTQLEAFLWTLNADASRLEACLNEQLFQDIGEQNWGDGEYPVFCFKPASRDQIKWVITTWGQLITANAVLPTEEDEAFIRKLMEMPPRNEQSTLLPQAQPADPQGQQNQDMPANKDVPANQDKPTDQEDPSKQDNQQSDNAKMSEALAGLKAEIEKLGAAPRDTGAQHSHPPASAAAPASKQRAFGKAMQRVAFAVIDKKTEDVAANSVPRLAGLMARAVKRVLGTDEQLKQLTDDDPSDIAAISLNGSDVGKVQNAAKDALMQGWKLGQDTAINEVERAKGERFTAAKRALHFKNLRDQAVAYFEANSFRMAGNLADGAKAIIQQELGNAVKFGTSLSQVRANIWDRLASKGFTTPDSVRNVEDDQQTLGLLQDLWPDASAAASAAYLDTLVRTNVFEALNEARFAEFTDPELQDFVQALEYAAVLDSSTTEYCRYMDNRIYTADSDVWNGHRPPGHYNCRSVLVPITTIDGWDGTESDPPTMDPQDGFGG